MPNFYLKKGVGTNDKIYYVCWTDKAGKPQRRSTRTADHGQAQIVLSRTVLELDRPRDVRPEELRLLQVLVVYHQDRKDDLDTLLPVRYCIRDVERYLGDCTVADFDDAKQDWYIRQLLTGAVDRHGAPGAKQSPGTVDRRLSVLIAALNHAVKPCKMLSEAPSIKRPDKVHAPGVRRFTLDEMRAVFANARTDNERTMLVLWTTSLCRPGAVLDLTWDRVDYEEHTIDYRVPGMKITNKRRAKVLMPPTVEIWLKARSRSDGPVITNMRKLDERVPLSTFKNHIKRICKRACIRGSAYRIRKAATSYLLNRGVALIQVQEMLAHKLGDGETYRYTEADLPPVLIVLERLLAEIAPDWLPLANARQMPVDKSQSQYSSVAVNGAE